MKVGRISNISDHFSYLCECSYLVQYIQELGHSIVRHRNRQVGHSCTSTPVTSRVHSAVEHGIIKRKGCVSYILIVDTLPHS